MTVESEKGCNGVTSRRTWFESAAARAERDSDKRLWSTSSSRAARGPATTSAQRALLILSARRKTQYRSTMVTRLLNPGAFSVSASIAVGAAAVRIVVDQ